MKYENFDEAKELVNQLNNLNNQLSELTREDQTVSIADGGWAGQHIRVNTRNSNHLLQNEAEAFIKACEERILVEIAVLTLKLNDL